MNYFDHYNNVCAEISKLTTVKYSTSFSKGIKLFHKSYHIPVYSIYGFVRFADEIVDTFKDYNQKELLAEFKRDTYKSINEKISVNPILQSFQKVVNEYCINTELIETFLNSMEMDLSKIEYDKEKYEKYILGSAEVVGLMCLKVFTDSDENKYQELKPYAMRLGAAFQKINFLRDINYDTNNLGRIYFPNLDIENFGNKTKQIIVNEIDDDFKEALKGIRKLNKNQEKGFIWLIYTTQAF